MTQHRQSVFIKRTLCIHCAKVSRLKDVWILNVWHSHLTHSLTKLQHAGRWRGRVGHLCLASQPWIYRLVYWSQIRDPTEFIWSQPHHTSIILPPFPANNSASIAHFTLACLLFLEGYAVKTLNWIWASRLSASREECFLLRFVEQSNRCESVKYLTVGSSCFCDEKCFMWRLWALWRLSERTFSELRCRACF